MTSGSDQWQPSGQPARWRLREEFLSVVAEGLAGTRPVDPEQAGSACSRWSITTSAPGQMDGLRHALPEANA
jgi:hypothetical protein